MFIFMLFLITFPLLSLALRGLCCWSQRCMRCVGKINNMMYFNTYLRFGLEASLELSISALVRPLEFRFGTNTDIMHSTFASFIKLALFSLLCFTLLYLQLNFRKLEDPLFKQRFGDVYQGLDTRYRDKVLSPFWFLLRRILYAALLVYWVDRSYF